MTSYLVSLCSKLQDPMHIITASGGIRVIRLLRTSISEVSRAGNASYPPPQKKGRIVRTRSYTFSLGRHNEDVTERVSVVQQPVLVVWHRIRVPRVKYPACESQFHKRQSMPAWNLLTTLQIKSS